MTLNEYQEQAQRTSREKASVVYVWVKGAPNNGKIRIEQLDNGLQGLCGEAGECMDILKKFRHQGHDLDVPKLIKELGDVMWYCAETAAALGVGLDEVARENIDKLLKRYPAGFESEKSLHRAEGDV